MAKMDELFNDMYNYCVENDCWRTWMTVGAWNNCLNKKYGSASFTALVKDGRLIREENYKGTAYVYRIIPTGEIKEKIEEEEEKERKQGIAEYIVAHYEERLAKCKAEYEERIKRAEEQYQHDLEWEAKMLADAKKALENANNNTELNK